MKETALIENESGGLLSPNDLDLWAQRSRIAGQRIKNAGVRAMIVAYLEHRAMGGTTKPFMYEHNVTWLDINTHLRGNLFPVSKIAESLCAAARHQFAEDEAFRRAVEGTEKPVFHKGQVCGHVREYSDSLMTLLLKAGDPDKYADRSKVTHNGAVLHLTVENMR